MLLSVVTVLLIGSNCSFILALEVHSQLIVDEGDDHTVMERDQRRWLVVSHLLLTLHKHKGSVGGKFVLVQLRDVPTVLVVIGDAAVVSRHGLKADVYLTLHRAANSEEWVLGHLEDDLVLDAILLLI